MAQKLDLQSIRQELEETETLLMNRLLAAGDESFDPASTRSRSELGKLYQNWMRNRTMSSQDEERLEQVQAALRRLDEGTYGKCTNCGRQINPERLISLPYAELCIRCQKKQESP